MSIAVCVGSNQPISVVRLAGALARRIQSAGKETILLASKGSITNPGPVALKELAASSTVKQWAGQLAKQHVQTVVSIMNLRACEAALQAKIPFIYVEYDGFKEEKPIKTKKSILKKAKKIVVLCEQATPASKRAYTGLKVDYVMTAALGVPHGSWGRPNAFKKANNIVAVGKLSKETGFDILLTCWAKLAPLHPSWQLTIVGDGAYKTNLNRLITKYYLQGSTEIVSAKNGIEPYLAQADIFAYTAQSANRAEELLCAMASTLPCIALENSTTGALITDGINGVLAADEAAFVYALDALMVDWGYRVGLAVKAAELKDRYSPERFVKTILENL